MINREKEWKEGIQRKLQENAERIRFIEMLRCSVEDASYEEKSVTMRFKMQEWERNQFGTVDGAVITAIMEIACGTLCNYMAGENDSVMSDLQTSFVRGLSCSGDAVAKVYLIKAGKTIIRTRGELFDGVTGKLAATAVASSFRK